MTNAKEELLYTLKNQQNLGKECSIKCAIITHENMWDKEKTKFKGNYVNISFKVKENNKEEEFYFNLSCDIYPRYCT